MFQKLHILLYFAGKLALVIPLPAAPEGFFNDGWIQMDETHLVRPTTRLVGYNMIFEIFFYNCNMQKISIESKE